MTEACTVQKVLTMKITKTCRVQKVLIMKMTETCTVQKVLKMKMTKTCTAKKVLIIKMTEICTVQKFGNKNYWSWHSLEGFDNENDRSLQSSGFEKITEWMILILEFTEVKALIMKIIKACGARKVLFNKNLLKHLTVQKALWGHFKFWKSIFTYTWDYSNNFAFLWAEAAFVKYL